VSRTLPMPCLDYAPIHALDMPKEYTWGHICLCYLHGIQNPMTSTNLFQSPYTLAGHHGVERTIKKLLNQPSWPFYVNIVKKFVLLVPLSKDIRHQNQKIHASPFVTSRYTPWNVST
jgi:hypothetical protein